MAAIFCTIIILTHSGNNILAEEQLNGGVSNLLSKLISGFNVTQVSISKGMQRSASNLNAEPLRPVSSNSAAADIMFKIFLYKDPADRSYQHTAYNPQSSRQ